MTEGFAPRATDVRNMHETPPYTAPPSVVVDSFVNPIQHQSRGRINAAPFLPRLEYLEYVPVMVGTLFMRVGMGEVHPLLWGGLFSLPGVGSVQEAGGSAT